MAELDTPVPEGVAPEGDEAPSFEPASLEAEEDGDAVHGRRFDELATKLKLLFDAERYPWLSEQSVVCTSTSYWGCENYARRTTRPGVVEMVNGRLRRMSSASREQRLALLQSLVDVASAVGRKEEPTARDELRFLAVGAVVDMVGAADEVRSQDIAAVVAALSVPGATAEAPRADVSSAEARMLLSAILAARKSGADPEVFRVWIATALSFRPLFIGDANGNPNDVDGVVAVWEALQGTLPELSAQRVEALRAIATQAPSQRRADVVRAWGKLIRTRAMEAQMAYERALDERATIIAELDAQKAATDASKDEIRGPALAALGGAVLTVAAVGLFLALLAVERNTRALRELLVGLEQRTQPPASASPPDERADPA